MLQENSPTKPVVVVGKPPPPNTTPPMRPTPPPAGANAFSHHTASAAANGGALSLGASVTRTPPGGGASVPTYKVIVVGDPAVGKSNLIIRFANGVFDLWRPPTIGVEFVCRRIELSPRPNDAINVQIYDTAGQDTFATLVPVFVRPAHAIMIVYDVTRRSTFLTVPGWMAQLQKWVSPDAVFCVVGNKTDLHHQIEVQDDEAIEMCSRLGCRYFSASARSGEGVSDAFLNIVLAAHSVASAKNVVEDNSSGVVGRGGIPAAKKPGGPGQRRANEGNCACR